MSAAGWGRALAAYVVALGLADLGLAAWLRLGGPSGAGDGGDVLSVWRDGRRVARRVEASAAGGSLGALGSGALAAEGAVPGTTVVRERIVGGGRVLTLGRRLFGFSFVAGRDGLRAALDGAVALLTPDDLLAAGLYRRVGIDPDGALERLAGELGCTADRLWTDGRFRRFAVAREVLSSVHAASPAVRAPADGERPGAAGDTTPTVVGDVNWVAAKPGGPAPPAAPARSAPVPAAPGPSAPASGPSAPASGPSAPAPAGSGPAAEADARLAADMRPTGPRLALAVRQASAFLMRRLGEDGRFAAAEGDGGSGEPAAPAGYDWTSHAAATALLAEADGVLDELPVRIAAQRAGLAMRAAAFVRCGGEACIAGGDRAETRAAAEAALAFGALGAARVGASFREPARELAAFLRGQQRADGGFWSAYDRARGAPDGDERADVDALAALALARAHRLTRAPADLAAAARALGRLARRPGGLGARAPLAVDPLFCAAADEVESQASGAPPALGATARELCLERAAAAAALEIGPAPVAEFAGGERCTVGWMPDVAATAARASASTAALAMGLRAGQSARSLTPVGARVTRALALLLRAQLPGARPYLQRDPAGAAGGFPATAARTEPRIDATVAAGAAMLGYLELLESRAQPTGPAGGRRARK